MAKPSVSDLSKFETQCLRLLIKRGRASVREIHSDVAKDLNRDIGYSTVRKIVERLENKGAVERVAADGNAVVYRATIALPALLRKVVHQLVSTLGITPRELVSHLVDTNDLSLLDLRDIEAEAAGSGKKSEDYSDRRPGNGRKRTKKSRSERQG